MFPGYGFSCQEQKCSSLDYTTSDGCGQKVLMDSKIACVYSRRRRIACVYLQAGNVVMQTEDVYTSMC